MSIHYRKRRRYKQEKKRYNAMKMRIKKGEKKWKLWVSFLFNFSQYPIELISFLILKKQTKKNEIVHFSVFHHKCIYFNLFYDDS